jgi:hypothetical protein
LVARRAISAHGNRQTLRNSSGLIVPRRFAVTFSWSDEPPKSAIQFTHLAKRFWRIESQL